MRNLKAGLLEINEEVKVVLDAIPDIIKIHKLDHTVCFYNKAGYEFYHKKPQDIVGKKCYKVLNRNKKCSYCAFSEIIRTKNKVEKEVYIPELNKVMDVCYTPILDNEGNLKFIIERMTDITEKKIVEKIMNSNTEKYIQITDNFPSAIVIIIDNKIVQANIQACSLFDTEYDEMIESNIYKYFEEKYVKVIHKKIRSVLSDYSKKEVFECEYRDENNNVMTLNVSLTPMIYEGKIAVLAAVKDISDEKKEINEASDFQRNSLQRSFPAKDYLNIKRVYAPANLVGGDSYRVSSKNDKDSDKEIIGLLMDVRGKGIIAALNISALDLLFLQEIKENKDPVKIVESLNRKLSEFYQENYVAVCCFRFDMENYTFEAVGAGINRFFYKPVDGKLQEVFIKGLFLGMFKDSEFTKETLKLNKGDKIYLFTDGLDFILNDNKKVKNYMNDKDIEEAKEYVYKCIEKEIIEAGKLRDDCTMLAIEVK